MLMNSFGCAFPPGDVMYNNALELNQDCPAMYLGVSIYIPPQCESSISRLLTFLLTPIGCAMGAKTAVSYVSEYFCIQPRALHQFPHPKA